MIVDIIVVVVLLISAVIAFLRGFIREVLTILGVFGGLLAAYFGGPLFLPLVNGWLGIEEGVDPEPLFGFFPYEWLAGFLAYGGIFVIVVVVLSVVSHVLAETVKNMGLGAIDRTFGVIFGIVRGVLLLGLLYMPVHLLVDDESKESWFEGSKTHFYLEQSSAMISNLLPDETVSKLHEDTKKIEESLSAKEKLQKINVLPKDEEDKNKENGNNGGYTEEFRGQMDDLFKQKSGGQYNE